LLPLVTKIHQFLNFHFDLNDTTERKVGRPTIDPAYRLATQAWFNAVSQASGGLTASELEQMFALKKPGSTSAPPGSSGIWGKYRDGKICPKFYRDRHGRPSIVERVERQLKGTSQWLINPFWRVLSYEPLSMNTLKEIYLQLPEPIMDLLVSEKPPYNRMFWRRPGSFEHAYKGLATMESLASCTALLALIKECETTQNQEMHKTGLRYWAMCARQLRSHAVLSSLVDGINNIIEDRYRRISYVSSDGNYFKLPIGVIKSTIKFSSEFNPTTDEDKDC
jgi:hypothetical protein